MKDNTEYKTKLISKAYKFARGVIYITDLFPKKRSAWIITDQLVRAATSIGANIIEAQAASSRKDFINFLNYSLKSGNETKFWLSLAKDLDPQLEKQLNQLITDCDELVRMLGSSISTLRGKSKSLNQL